jgi:tRNA1(Val) A37 N6-methylase TrmN6
MEYSNISKELTIKLSKTIKQASGIYFTPPSMILDNIKLLEPYIQSITNVLEPSCGSCEYISALIKKYNHLKITGIELNKTIYDSIKEFDTSNVKLYNEDYLNYESIECYDLIIGNPPYFVMKKEKVDKSYYKYFEGRPNIFILFIIKSITLLKENGIISFVLPKNFLNCLYYDKTRHYINKHFQILDIVECVSSKYIETQQPTILLIIKKAGTPPLGVFTSEGTPPLGVFTSAGTPPLGVFTSAGTSSAGTSSAGTSSAGTSSAGTSSANEDYVLERSNFTIFATKTNCIKLKKLFLNSTSLESLGFKVSIGSIVWNQCKSLLTNDSSKTRLIYSSSIENNTLSFQIYKNEEKKNYINKKGICRPMIVVNRGYGVGQYKFNYCLINEEYEYLVENHLITIEYTKELPKDELLKQYNKIIVSLNHSNTLDFVTTYFGNAAINSSELSQILPIYEYYDS